MTDEIEPGDIICGHCSKPIIGAPVPQDDDPNVQLHFGCRAKQRKGVNRMRVATPLRDMKVAWKRAIRMGHKTKTIPAIVKWALPTGRLVIETVLNGEVVERIVSRDSLIGLPTEE